MHIAGGDGKRLVARAEKLTAFLELECAIRAGSGYVRRAPPGKLQSEDYQLHHETLQIIQQKSGQLVVDATSLTAVTNPALPALPSRGEGDQ